jgi:serine/threonine-protein kinase
MDSSHWVRLEELLAEGARLPLPERAAFVERETSTDPALRAELSSLLAVYDQSADYVHRLRQDVLGTDVQAILREPPAGADAPDPWIGRQVSHYEITDRIGGGGMGVIYRARDLRLDRQVALKFIAPELRRDSEARRRFKHEARAASALDHPNICTIHDIHETDDGRAFIVMAAYDGETLRERIARGPLPVSEAIDIAGQVSRALEAAHARDIVHRDVKPENIFITRDGGVKLLDFGLASTSDGAMSGASGLEGTVAYMSPEQAEGHRAEAPSDVWALGVVLFEMLAGIRPFAAETPSATIERIRTSEPTLALLPVQLPTGVVALITRALRKDPPGRFANGGELLQALHACGDGVSRTNDPRRGLGRSFLPGGAAAAGVALLLAVILVRGRSGADSAGVPQTAVAAGGAHVLWVDDDPSNNAKQVQILAKRGVGITTAVSTAEALERYDPAVHDVVVSDMGRPEGAKREYVPRAGLELVLRLRARDPGVAVVLYTTARSADLYGAEARAAGVHAVVTETEDLLRMLTAWTPAGAGVDSPARAPSPQPSDSH